MSHAKPDGGPAFPGVEGTPGYGNATMHEGPNGSLFTTHNQGMTLRDYLAAHAPITISDAKEVFGDPDAKMVEEAVCAGVLMIYAMLRYQYADAMIKERKE